MKILYEDILSTYNKIKPFLKVTETSYSEQISKKFVDLCHCENTR